MPDLVCPQCEHECESTHKFCPICGFPLADVATKQEDPLLGTTLPGGYVIQELVGVGGMGRVYRAEQKVLSRTVAVKIIHPHLLGDDSASARFITEARAASRLNHPNSVSVIDFGRNGGQLYLVMEYLRGRDLARVTYDDGFLPIPRLIDIMCQVLAALAEAHHLDIIHRDLKPENVVIEPMRSGGDFVKVVDFGLAKMRETNTNITTPGLVCGTPDYMAPEQGRGDPIDARSDLYACGVLLFQLLTGRLPFEAENPTQVVLMHLSDPPPDPRELAPDRAIPDALAELTLKALSKHPADRFQSADEFSVELKSVLEFMSHPAEDWAELEFGTKCSSCGAGVPGGQKFCGDCGARVSTAATGSATQTSPPLPLPFCGRDADLEWLHAARDAVGSWVTTARIYGESGIGKSRLFRQFARAVSEEGDLVVECTPDPFGAAVGYFALRQAIVGLAELPADGGAPADWTGATSESARGLLEIFSRSNTVTPDPRHLWEEEVNDEIAERRFAVSEALRWAMARAARETTHRRVLLMIDDLHAIDGASRNAFLDVVQEPPLVGILMVASHPAFFEPEWDGPSRGLLGLPAAELEPLLEGMVAIPDVDRDGLCSPLLADQLLRFALEGGKNPATKLGDLMAARLERLEPSARKLLQALAVFGDGFEPGPVLEAVDISDPDGAMDELRQRGFVEIAEKSLRISHPLIRDLALASTPAEVKRDLHSRASDGSIVGTTELPIEALAVHAFHAQNSFEALMLLETVAVRAEQRGDLSGSIGFLRRALELARWELFRGDIDEPLRAVQIFSRKLAHALVLSGDLADARGVLLEALDLVETTSTGTSSEDRVLLWGALAYVAHRSRRVEESSRYLKLALDLAKEELLASLVDSLERARKSWRSSGPRPATA